MPGQRRDLEARSALAERSRYLGKSMNRRLRRRLSFQAVEKEAC
jgi:hypothetical protein